MSKRIVSLLSSATEIIAALDLGDALVGRSHECDFPAWVRELPCVTASRVHTSSPSTQIDAEIKGILAAGESVYRVDAQLLRTLKPDLIATQKQCEVCAVSPRDVQAALVGWTGQTPRIVELNPNCLADVWADIHAVAEAAGVREVGETLVARLQQRIHAISSRADSAERRPRVACLEWLEPLMAAGNWMPELVDLAGGISLFGEVGRHSPRMTWDQLRQSDPDVILLMPCGFDLARTMQDLSLLTARSEWCDLSAVRRGRVFATDGNQYFNRPGPRLVDSVEILAEILHPELFESRHRDIAWRLVSSHGA